MSPNQKLHVMRYEDGWAVIPEKANNVPILTCSKQQKAIKEGRQYAIENKCELIIHNRMGQICDWISYNK